MCVRVALGLVCGGCFGWCFGVSRTVVAFGRRSGGSGILLLHGWTFPMFCFAFDMGKTFWATGFDACTLAPTSLYFPFLHVPGHSKPALISSALLLTLHTPVHQTRAFLFVLTFYNFAADMSWSGSPSNTPILCITHTSPAYLLCPLFSPATPTCRWTVVVKATDGTCQRRDDSFYLPG